MSSHVVEPLVKFYLVQRLKKSTLQKDANLLLVAKGTKQPHALSRLLHSDTFLSNRLLYGRFVKISLVGKVQVFFLYTILYIHKIKGCTQTHQHGSLVRSNMTDPS